MKLQELSLLLIVGALWVGPSWAAKRGDPSRLQPVYSYGDFARMRANVEEPTQVRRATRNFHQVLEPLESYWSPNPQKIKFLKRSQRWELTPREQGRPRPIENPAPHRSLWMRFHLARIPRQAVIEKAELRMQMWPSDLRRFDPERVRAHLALQTIVPERLMREWRRNIRGEGHRLHFNYPSMWWDVKEFVRLSQPTGEIFRPFGVVVENAGQLFERRPELHIWYRLPVSATAE